MRQFDRRVAGRSQPRSVFHLEVWPLRLAKRDAAVFTRYVRPGRAGFGGGLTRSADANTTWILRGAGTASPGTPEQVKLIVDRGKPL